MVVLSAVLMNDNCVNLNDNVVVVVVGVVVDGGGDCDDWLR